MNRFIVISHVAQLEPSTVYALLQPMSEGTAPFGPTYQSSSSWKKFIRTSTQPVAAESTMTFIPATKTTTEVTTTLKPSPIPEDYDARKEAFRRFLDSLEEEASENVTTEHQEPSAQV